MGAASDIEKQDRNILRVFGQFRRFRIGGNEALDGLWHELREVVFGPAQLTEFPINRVLQAQRSLHAGQ